MEEHNQVLIDLLNQLAQVQANLSAVVSTRFEKQTEEIVINKLDKKKEYIANQAARYGQDPNSADKSIRDYYSVLENTRKEFVDEKNLWLAQSEESQKNEIQNALDIIALRRAVAFNQAPVQQLLDKKQQLLDSRKDSVESAKTISEISNDFSSILDQIFEDQALVKIRHNPFSKLIAKIKNSFSGKENFVNNVIKPLDSKNAHIQQSVLPSIKNSINQSIRTKHSILLETGINVLPEDRLRELSEIAKQGDKSIIERASGFKQSAIASFSKGFNIAKRIINEESNDYQKENNE